MRSKRGKATITSLGVVGGLLIIWRWNLRIKLKTKGSHLIEGIMKGLENRTEKSKMKWKGTNCSRKVNLVAGSTLLSLKVTISKVDSTAEKSKEILFKIKHKLWGKSGSSADSTIMA